MAEELLDDEERRLVYGHVGAHGMADRVWRDGLGYTRGADVFFDYVLHGTRGQRLIFPDPREEQGFAAVEVGVEATAGEEDELLNQSPELR